MEACVWLLDGRLGNIIIATKAAGTLVWILGSGTFTQWTFSYLMKKIFSVNTIVRIVHLHALEMDDALA